ncbi:non-specific serine/threonine protein kinase [Ranunculus cassubicifolius]
MMLNTFHFIISLISLCIINQFSQTSANLGNSSDLNSLLSIKAEIQGLTSWNKSLHFCNWQGITCGNTHQRVISLNLSSQNLIGTLSPSIGNLSFLRYINLESNQFSGKIPQEIGKLFRLQDFIVYNNTFVGEIPVNITQCKGLVSFDIEKNNFSGKIPPEIGSLGKLETLRLPQNQLTGGIPVELGNLSSLVYFSVGENKLEGKIPDTLGKLAKLETFIVQLNEYFTGEIPPAIYNISSLQTLSVLSNRLTGSFPPDLGIILPNLREVYANGNQFSGPLPRSLANATNLELFDVLVNEFTGDVPNNLGSLQNLYWFAVSHNNLGRGEAGDWSFIDSLTNCSSLTTLSLSINNFGGVLPMSISNFSSPLKMLYLGDNPVSGPIPEEIGNLGNLGSLIVLGLDATKLNGTIPASIGNIQTLQRLLLSDSEYTGTIPSSLSNITQLTELGLGGNRLEGSIPSSFGGYQSMQILNVSTNNLSGSIPKEIFSISSLSTLLDLSQNYFTGSLPAEVGNLNNLVRLDVSGNKLSGEVPSGLSKCSSLEELYLENNSFQGTFPQSLKSLRVIRYIDVSSNNLSGPFPKYLEDLPYLEDLDLSNNKLEGEVPRKGVFQNASNIAVDGNLNLCGGTQEMRLKVCPTEGSKKKGKSISFKVAISIASGLVFLVFCALLIIYMRKKPQEKVSSSNSLKGRLKVSYGELFRATDGFSPNNFLGSGGFGRVYKGKMEHDEAIVAVKVFDLHQKGASKSFTAECESLRGIRHRNLVKIVTSCSSTDYEGNDFKALVFEFMSNGSLDDWLHPDSGIQEDHPRSLNLLQRLNAATDVATALNYLHHECYTTIIHRDLKPSNVLLDDDMVAHVGDFGLAKLLWGPMENLSETHTMSLGIKGSIGYAAPEYGMGGGASTQADTYSYGILLLELFTGKRPTDVTFVDGLDMHTYARDALPDTVRHIVDPVLISAEEEIETIEECIASVVKIGVACSAQSPGERMDMEEVAKDLHSIRDKFIATVERKQQ